VSAPLQFRLEPRPFRVHLGVTVGNGSQFIEHGCHIARMRT
jgi:hypothetical protein